ncbi:MAG: DNA polymerase III subunit delta [Bacteroidales bacterium]|jgi:DNA polymerase-3 subunit delta|nr:DNA polymerase III subunit delta [Bacteroidales bacterium]MCI2121299.1 DNA polymerase III subunit delta [Bacteroidales bacterium]MCI2145211.1 DNA polymerase III subunit delta [Bacteroidales bacterium]
MARQSTQEQFDSLMKDVDEGRFACFYLLMGEEPYYIDSLSNAIAEKAVTAEMRDFNRIVIFGQDADADKIIGTARQFPMIGDRLVVIVREAQMMSGIEKLAAYLISPMPSTVLVICYKGKSIDKRTSFYKQASKSGVVMESMKVPDYKTAGWIENYVWKRKISIDPEAAALMAECTGTDLQKITLEVDKLLKMLPEGTVSISVKDVEDNVGISREYSVFELSKAFSYRDSDRVYRIALNFADSPKQHPIQLTIGMLASTFLKVLRYHSLKMKGAGKSDISSTLGINPYFLGEYEAAAKNYPLKKTMEILNILKDYDHKSKSNMRGEANDGDLLVEMASRILDA